MRARSKVLLIGGFLGPGLAGLGALSLPRGFTVVLVAVAAALVSWTCGGSERVLFGLAALLMRVTGAIYPLYYTEANAAFGSGSIPLSEVGAELARWENWHWARTACGTLAFALAVRGLSMRAVSHST